MFRFVTTIPKDILKNLKNVKTPKKPHISLENKFNLEFTRMNLRYNLYKKKFNDFLNMEVENNLFK